MQFLDGAAQGRRGGETLWAAFATIAQHPGAEPQKTGGRQAVRLQSWLGRIGGYYGAMLQNGGADVTFIARGSQLAALRQGGIAVEASSRCNSRR